MLLNNSQNDTSHHAPKRLENSEKSEPGDAFVEFIHGLYPAEDDSDTTNAASNNHVALPERSGASYEEKRLINALGQFTSNFGEAKLDYLFAKFKASRDKSKKMGHPQPTR
jgi:hypothetical protein